MENGYYNAKGIPPICARWQPALKEEDPRAALDEFRVVVETESAAGEKGDWSPISASKSDIVQGLQIIETNGQNLFLPQRHGKCSKIL